MRRQRIVRIASMSSASRKRATTVHRTLPVPAVRSMVGRLALWQSVISGPKRWMNDEMGKAAHVGVGRLLSLADLGNWPHKGVIQMGGSNEFVRPSTSSAGARLHEQRAGIKNMDFKQKLNIILCFHTYKYSPYVDEFIKKLINDGEVLNYDRYRAKIKWRGVHYGVWIENYPYADLGDVRKYSDNTFLYRKLRPSRATQIAFWDWMNKQGVYPNRYDEMPTDKNLKALLTKTKL